MDENKFYDYLIFESNFGMEVNKEEQAFLDAFPSMAFLNKKRSDEMPYPIQLIMNCCSIEFLREALKRGVKFRKGKTALIRGMSDLGGYERLEAIKEIAIENRKMMLCC